MKMKLNGKEIKDPHVRLAVGILTLAVVAVVLFFVFGIILPFIFVFILPLVVILGVVAVIVDYFNVRRKSK